MGGKRWDDDAINDVLRNVAQGGSKQWEVQGPDWSIRTNGTAEDHTGGLEALHALLATRFVPWKDLLLDIAGPHVPTLAEAIQSYSEVEARDLKPNTWSQRKRALKEFAEAIGGDHPVSEISKRMASTWSDGLIKEGKSKVYAANCVSHVAQLFDALERKDVASDNPVRGLIVVKKKEKAALRSKSLYRPENEAVWASFRQLRKAAQFSQEEFGQRLGRNQSYVSAAETGVIRLDALQIREWCQAAGTDMRTWLAVLEAQLAAVAVVEEGIPPR